MKDFNLEKAITEVKELISKQADLYEANAPQAEQAALEKEVLSKKLDIANHVIWYGGEVDTVQRNEYTILKVSVQGGDSIFTCVWKDKPRKSFPIGTTVALRLGQLNYVEAYVVACEKKLLTVGEYAEMAKDGMLTAWHQERLILQKYGFDPEDNLARD